MAIYKDISQQPANGESSKKGEVGSNSFWMRSRTNNFPLSSCLLIAFSPPPLAISSTFSYSTFNMVVRGKWIVPTLRFPMSCFITWAFALDSLFGRKLETSVEYRKVNRDNGFIFCLYSNDEFVLAMDKMSSIPLRYFFPQPMTLCRKCDSCLLSSKVQIPGSSFIHVLL